METSRVATADGTAMAEERQATIVNAVRNVIRAFPLPLLRGFVRYSYLPLRAVLFLGRPQSEPRPAIVRTRVGFKMLVSTSNQVVDESIWWFGLWEPRITAIFEGALERQDVCIDVGANIGYHSLLASRLVGKEGRVFAFEPGAAAAHILALNIGLNRASNIEVSREAVSDSTGTIELREHVTGRLGLIGPYEEGQRFTVPSITLDEAIGDVDPMRMRLLKIDVQGGELGVLRGAPELLKKAERLFVVCEVSRDGAEIFDLMAEHGYHAYLIPDSYSTRALARIRRPQPSLTLVHAPPSKQADILFKRGR